MPLAKMVPSVSWAGGRTLLPPAYRPPSSPKYVPVARSVRGTIGTVVPETFHQILLQADPVGAPTLRVKVLLAVLPFASFTPMLNEELPVATVEATVPLINPALERDKPVGKTDPGLSEKVKELFPMPRRHWPDIPRPALPPAGLLYS